MLENAKEIHPGGHKDAFGPLLEFLTEVTSEAHEYCLAHCIFPSGAVVPVHSHEDRETFHIISGELEVWNGSAWRTLHGGDTLDVPGDQPHAFRNRSGLDALALLVTTMKMGRFFGEIMVEPTDAPVGPPSPELLVRLGEVSLRYGYRMGSPEDNATAGLN